MSNPQEGVNLNDLLPQVMNGLTELKSSYGEYPMHPSQQVSPAAAQEVLAELLERLEGNAPLYSRGYIGQMLKPPHPVAVAAYLATMQINPNNHSIDGGRATTLMEREVLEQMAAMFDYPTDYLGHLTWSGTTANLEGLWVSRELRPDKAIVFSKDAHYTHARMAEVLNVPSIGIPTDAEGKMNLVALEEQLQQGNVSVVVATLGTTGLGAIDPLAEILALAKKYQVRVHVDAAYGGFFKLILDLLEPETARHFSVIGQADSIVVDPHKQGLQPYGSGSVFFKDHTVGRFYKHDSPYTYFASKDVHFGEIQLETSRAGASAAAFWATTKVLPLSRSGLGEVLAAQRRATMHWFKLLSDSQYLVPYQAPELDILAYFPKVSKMSEIDQISEQVFREAFNAPRADQLHLAEYKVSAEALLARGHSIEADIPVARILRSVVMKPEHEPVIADIHSRIESITKALITNE
ncbi:MAG: pyridoxal phosphate-dependent decarboxylase family protein [Micrococcales bacterium]